MRTRPSVLGTLYGIEIEMTEGGGGLLGLGLLGLGLLGLGLLGLGYLGLGFLGLSLKILLFKFLSSETSFSISMSSDCLKETDLLLSSVLFIWAPVDIYIFGHQ